MFGLDNKSGINVMPPIAPADSQTPLWFTEGGAGLSATYPGQDWFNQIQAELLNVLNAAGIAPQKGNLSQLSSAISKLASAYAINIVHTTGQSLTSVMSQKAVTDLMQNKLDKTTGGKILAPVSVSGRRVNSGILVVDTMTDGNNVGDGQTQLGYNTGTEEIPVFSHFLRGAGTVFVDTLNGLTAQGVIKSLKTIEPKDYSNFDNRFLQLSKLGDKAGQVPDMSLFQADLGYNGWQTFPTLDGGGNLIMQWGSFGQFKAGDGVIVNFKKPFPKYCVFAIAITVRLSTSATTQEAAYLAEKSAAFARFTKGGTETSDGVWLALGY